MTGRMRRALACRLVAAALGLALGLVLGGCPSMEALDSGEQESVRAGQSVLVLVRFTCLFDGAPTSCFPRSLAFEYESWVDIWLEGLETASDPEYAFRRPPSERARREGWMAFALAPGTHYLYVKTRRTAEVLRGLGQAMTGARRFRLDVPEGVAAIYAGSLSATFDVDDLGLGILWAGPEFTLRTGDAAAAGEIAASLMPGVGTVPTVPMAPWPVPRTRVFAPPRRLAD